MTGKSVIFLFLHGGPSQIETFDPKMDAPAEHPQRHRRDRHDAARRHLRQHVSASWRAWPTSWRSSARFRTGDANPRHQADRRQGHARGEHGLALRPRRRHERSGNRHAAQRRASSRGRSIPSAARAVEQLRQVRLRPAAWAAPTRPFVPGGGGSLQKDMQLKLDPTRIDDRRNLLTEPRPHPPRPRRQRRALPASIAFRSRRFRRSSAAWPRRSTCRRKTPRRSPATTRPRSSAPSRSAASGTTTRNYVDNAKSLGKLLLLARRLCEAGCGFVTVTTNFVWDMHADVNNAGVEEGMQYMGRPLDHAVSAFIEDCEARGLSRQDPARRYRRDGPHAARSTPTAAATTGAASRRCCSTAAA